MEVSMRISGCLTLGLLALPLALGGILNTSALADPGDTTWVTTFDHDFYNWATAHVDTFDLPDTTVHWSKILLYYKIGCPEAPGDCDPWDRIGWTEVLVGDTTDVEAFEIARIVTPYDITGGSRPDSCTWVLDVSDYKTFLHDTVVLRNYIESWIGGDRGWLVTITFAFIEGEMLYEPVKVMNMWTNRRIVYGDPERPHEDHLQPMIVDIDPDVDVVKFRATSTGHGQGNTHNCAEFCNKWHAIAVGPDTTSYNPWRGDCVINPCSPQGGTWQYARAGWCPGDKVDPWDLDVTYSVTPGMPAEFNYDIQPYENLCRPNNPDCVPGVTCPDCNYNYTGHTEPHFCFISQLVFYEMNETVSASDGAVAADFELGQNFPNPFNPTTTFSYTLPRPGSVTVVIHDVGGRIVRSVKRSHSTEGTFRFRWDGIDDHGHTVRSGVYFYELQYGGQTVTKKMILLE